MTTAARPATALGLGVALAVAGCQSGAGDASTPSPTPHTPAQLVQLDYAVPTGFTEVAMPSSTPTSGMTYDIKLFQGPSNCDLRVVRMLASKASDQEDEEATYDMMGAIMSASGVTSFKTNGSAVAGTPGPVPVLTASGSSSSFDLRALGRMAEDSLQGFEVVYGCPKGKLDATTWTRLVSSLRVDGFTGSLGMH